MENGYNYAHKRIWRLKKDFFLKKEISTPQKKFETHKQNQPKYTGKREITNIQAEINKTKQ